MITCIFYNLAKQTWNVLIKWIHVVFLLIRRISQIISLDEFYVSFYIMFLIEGMIHFQCTSQSKFFHFISNREPDTLHFAVCVGLMKKVFVLWQWICFKKTQPINVSCVWWAQRHHNNCKHPPHIVSKVRVSGYTFKLSGQVLTTKWPFQKKQLLVWWQMQSRSERGGQETFKAALTFLILHRCCADARLLLLICPLLTQH